MKKKQQDWHKLNMIINAYTITQYKWNTMYMKKIIHFDRTILSSSDLVSNINFNQEIIYVDEDQCRGREKGEISFFLLYMLVLHH